MKFPLAVAFVSLTLICSSHGLKCVCSDDFVAEKSQQQTQFEEKVQRVELLARDGNCTDVETMLEEEKRYFEQEIGLNFTEIQVNVTENTTVCSNIEFGKVIKAMRDFYRLLSSCRDGECDVDKSCSDSLVCQQYAKDGQDVQRCFHAFGNGKDLRGCQMGPLPETECVAGSSESSFDYTCDYDYCNGKNQFERYCVIQPAILASRRENATQTVGAAQITTNETFAAN